MWGVSCGLCVLVLLLMRQNGALREAVAERDAMLEARLAQESLKPGDRLGAIGLYGASGAVSELGFGGEMPATVVFAVSAGCAACDLAMPAWDAMVGEGLPEVRLVCVDVTAAEPGALSPKSAVLPWYGTGEPGWLREVPVTPSVVVIRGDGEVVGVWNGHRASRRTGEIRAAIEDAAG